MIAVLLLIALAFVAWRVARRRRAARLSGTTAAAPLFQVPPPAGRLGNLKNERL